MNMQTSGIVDVWGKVQELGMQTALYQVLGAMPGGKIVQFFFLITVCMSFITLADPNTSALSTLCVHGQEIDSEPPKLLKIIIGIAVSAVAYLLVVSGGMDAVKGLLNVGGLLMTIPTIWLCFMIFKLCKPLLNSKSHRMKDIPCCDEVEPPTKTLTTKMKGLGLVVDDSPAESQQGTE